MNKLDNVSVVKKANVYFDGNVTSRTVLLEDGEKKALGIILPGQYEFETNDKEHMELLAGKLKVLFSNGKQWITIKIGQIFEIPAHSKFKIIAEEQVKMYQSNMKVWA